jgi:hypothetical protein
MVLVSRLRVVAVGWYQIVYQELYGSFATLFFDDCSAIMHVQFVNRMYDRVSCFNDRFCCTYIVSSIGISAVVCHSYKTEVMESFGFSV